MKQAIFELDAQRRQGSGKGASRRLRRQDQIPAILYGGAQAPTAIQLPAHKVRKALENDAFYSHILTLKVDGEKEQVVLKALQRHHFKKSIFHMDFQRVKPTDVINMKVPIHFLNEATCLGVKAGGIINHQLINVEIRCQAKDLPEAITVDMANIKLDEAVHLSDLTLPKGAELVALSHDPAHANKPVVSVHKAKVIIEPEPVETTEETEDTTDNKEKSEQEAQPKGK